MNIENGGGVGINCLGFYGNNGKMNARSLLRLLQLVSTFHCDVSVAVAGDIKAGFFASKILKC